MTSFAVLFVCMGNICRSPTAHGVFKRKLMDAGIAHHVKVDSAGTHNYHPGSPPDARSQLHRIPGARSKYKRRIFANVPTLITPVS